VKVAFITATPSTIAAFLSYLNSRHIQRISSTVATVEKNTNDMLSKLKVERDTATARADQAEGHAEGVKAEQDRTTKGI
jgi:hypothetical protein